MESEIVIAIIGLIGAIILDVFVQIRGWNKVSKQLGVGKQERSISTQLGVKDNSLTLSKQITEINQYIEDSATSISNELGIVFQDGKSLSVQHKDIKNDIHEIKKDLSIPLNNIQNRLQKQEDEKNTLRNILTPTQANIKEATDKITSMISNWQDCILINNKLIEQVQDLQKTIEKLQSEKEKYLEQINSLKDENEKLMKPKQHSRTSDYELEL